MKNEWAMCSVQFEPLIFGRKKTRLHVSHRACAIVKGQMTTQSTQKRMSAALKSHKNSGCRLVLLDKYDVPDTWYNSEYSLV